MLKTNLISATKKQLGMVSFNPLGTIVILVISILYYPTIEEITNSWSSVGDRYSHGWFIFAITIYLLARIPSPKISENASIQKWPLAGLAGVGFLIYVLNITGISIIQWSLMPLLIILFTYSINGWTNTKAYIFPILYLFLALPVWNVINPYLQSLTVFINGVSLSLLNFPAHINGNYITIPNGTFQVAGGCSGFKYFISSLALSLLYAYLYCNSLRNRVIVVVIGILLALIANWIRVFCLILIGNFEGMDHELIKDHDDFGWVLYGISLLIFFWLANKFATSNIQSNNTNISKDISEQLIQKNMWLSLTTLSIPTLAFVIINNLPIKVSTPLKTESLPSNWVMQENLNYDWIINYSNEDNALSFGLKHLISNRNLDIQIKQYNIHTSNKPFIDYKNTLIQNNWHIVSDKKSSYSQASFPHRIAIIMSPNNEKYVIGYWYKVGEYQSISKRITKINQLKTFLERVDGATITSISTICHSRCSKEQSYLEQWIEKYGKTI